MPRSARLILPGCWYHLLSRGNNRQALFRCDEDFRRYLELLDEYQRRYSFRLSHYCLMTNHVHLLVFSGQGSDLKKAMQGIQLSYNWWVRRRYGFVGHLWQGRFKSFLIKQESYLTECSRYIARNPLSAKIVSNPASYPWSSYQFYVKGCPDKFVSLTPDPGYLALAPAPEDRQRRYRDYVETNRPYELPEPERLHPVFQGW